jgi:hypothetical protein|nr:MAG TPA: MNT REPRESSOR MUTANT WITH C-TERMINAL REGULATION [Caudoviricetes sp.]
MNVAVIDNSARVKKTLAVRLMNSELERKVEELARAQNLSINMTINMLIGFAFNEIQRQNKEFIPKIIFESK